MNDMLPRNTIPSRNEENIFNALLHKFLPFWPYFIGLLVFFLAISWVYMQLATPVYGITAKLIIKDEKKGVNDSKIMESINPFDSKKIVENEIQVIQSKEIIKRAVDSLMLYAPLFEQYMLNNKSAYTTSPIHIKVENPNRIAIPEKETVKHDFVYDTASKKVFIDGKQYPVDQWVDFPFGRLMFIENERQQAESENPLYFELVHPNIITEGIVSNLEVASADKLSTVVDLSYTDPVRLRGEDVLNAIIHSYTNKAEEDRNSLAENTLNFIEDRILNVEKELNTLEGEVQQYRADVGAVDLTEQSRLYLQDAGENDRQISSINLQLTVLDRIESYVVSKNNQGGIVPSTAGINDPVLSQLLEKLYNSEIEYASLRKTTAENNPLVLSIADEIEKIRPSILENIRNQQANLRASLRNLNTTSGRFSSRLKSIPEKERALLEIKRRESMKSDLFSFLLQKREETALMYAPSEGDSKIVEKAAAGLYPISPKPILLYGTAFLLAFAIGIVFVVGKELINDKILFRSEIEKATRLPILGEVGYVERPNGTSFLRPEEDMIIEQFRQLCAKLGLYSRAMSKKTILITSSISGEGKSFVSANLAYSLANLGKKVVLLDMDFRKPDASRSFGLANKTGIIQFLGQEADLNDILNKSELNDNLSIVSAGTNGGDYTSLLLNREVEALFDELKKQFDYVIIDSAPINVTSDANLLAEYSDVKLLVTRHSFTPKAIVNRFDQTENNKILSKAYLIFNGVKTRGFVAGAGYGYGNVQHLAYGRK